MVEQSKPAVGGLTEADARALEPQLRKFLRARYRLVSDHDDLIQQVLGDLHLYLVKGALVARSIDDMTALAFTILKRRIIDRFREEAKHFAYVTKTYATSETVAPSAETVVTYKELLATVMNFMASMNESDRTLLFITTTGTERTAPMTPAERQRLSRLRAQLRSLLLQQGVSPQDIKKDFHG